MRQGRDRRAPAASPEETYYAAGFTDANYYQSAAGAGRGLVGTVRLVGFVITRPTTPNLIICGRQNSTATGGWRLQTGFPASSDFTFLNCSSSTFATSPARNILVADVGKLFVVHAWADAAGAHLAWGGAEVGAGAGGPGWVPADASGSDRLQVGRYQHSGGFSNPHIGVIALSISPTVLTLAEIAADAAQIMARPSRLIFPDMSGMDESHVARDLLNATDWPDRIGNDVALSRVGSPMLTKVI